MTKMPTRTTLSARWAAACLFAACLAAPLDAQAKGFTYKYVGQPYTSVAGGTCLTTSMHLAMTVVLPAKLPANFSGQVIPTAWAANDGKTRFSSKSNFASGQFVFATDANGAIFEWQVEAFTYSASFKESLVGTSNLPSQSSAGDLALIPCRKGTSGAGNTVAGAW